MGAARHINGARVIAGDLLEHRLLSSKTVALVNNSVSCTSLSAAGCEGSGAALLPKLRQNFSGDTREGV